MKPYLKNSLISVTGISLINHPGIVFPKEVLQPRRGFRKETGSAYRNKPINGISTREASVLLGCSLSGARQYLRRKQVRFVLVKESEGCLSCYWDEKVVRALSCNKLQLVHSAPAGYYSTEEVLEILNVIRSTLYRLSKKGVLCEKKVRIRSKRGTRIRSFYSKSSVADALRRFRQGAE